MSSFVCAFCCAGHDKEKIFIIIQPNANEAQPIHEVPIKYMYSSNN